MTEKNKIQFTESDNVVQVHLPDGRTLSGPRNSSVEEFLAPLMAEDGAPIVGVILNGALRELTYPIKVESQAIPVRMNMADGMRIYRRSLTLLLEASFKELFPDSGITIDHSVSFGGYYCQIRGRGKLSEKEIIAVKEKMLSFRDQDIAIERREVPLDQAIKDFTEAKKLDKVRLLKHRKKDYLMIYHLGDHKDYHHGYMVPSTRYLKWFDIKGMGEGFILQFPRRHRPTEIMEMGHYPKLIETFRIYGDWLNRLGIESVGALNDSIDHGRIREVILVSEALHEQQIAQISNLIAEKRDQVRIVSIAGPSSSGKTTSSRRLSVQLLARGIHPYPLELDNYFVDRVKTPKDEDGNFDFESLDALNIKQLNQDLKKLIAGEEVQLPRYDFHTGESVQGKRVQLKQNEVIIVEGIHGLNPGLIQEIPSDKIFRIYISALTQLNLDHHNRVSTTDTRLIRRIVRDAKHRGYSPQETIQRWESVRRGEKRNIFPYQENADVMFNSALVYELSALKSQAEPLLRQVPFGSSEHLEAKRLLALLEWFLPLDTEMIPDNSLLREFLGGSILKDFSLWRGGKN